MAPINLEKVDSKVKAASAMLLAMQTLFVMGAIGSVVTFFAAIQTNPFAAFMASISAIGCVIYVIDFGNRRKTGEQRYEIIRSDYIQSQRMDAYRSVLGDELDKRFPTQAGSGYADAVGFSMTGSETRKAYAGPDTGSLVEDFRSKLRKLQSESDPQPIVQPTPPPFPAAEPTVPAPCIVVPYDEFKRRQDERKKKSA